MEDQLDSSSLQVPKEDHRGDNVNGNGFESYSCEDSREQFHGHKELVDQPRGCLSQLNKSNEVPESSDVDPQVDEKKTLSVEALAEKSAISSNEGVENAISSDNEKEHSKPHEVLDSETSISNVNGSDNDVSPSLLDVPEIFVPKKKGGKYKCEYCSKTFTKKDAVLNHMKNHSAKKQHQCETCGKTFGFKGNLNVHMRIHTGFKPFICDICGKSFSQKGNLNTHSTIHLKKHFDCNDCSKCFADRKSLENHMKTHSPVPVKKSVDIVKPVVATKPVAVKNGAMKKGGSGRQPGAGKTYECMACGQCFADQVSVVDHMMINHTVENTS